MLVVFHGRNARLFMDGFEALCAEGGGPPPEVVAVGDGDRSPEARRAFREADVIVGTRFRDPAAEAPRLRLLQLAMAGTEGVDFALLPPSAAVCNCFGHEEGISEFVLLAMLLHAHPVLDADRRLRRGDWYWSAAGQRPGPFHDELAGRTVGLLGYGRIGQAVARRARAFDLEVVAANRTPVTDDPLVDLCVPLSDPAELYARADFIVCALPLAPETRSLVDAAAFARMRASAYLINVGRGPVVDEEALYRALAERRIAGACVDTWYVYPGADDPAPHPSRFPFHELDNVLMTPHMSGWTIGTRRRRQRAIAENVNRLRAGRPLLNVVREARA